MNKKSKITDLQTELLQLINEKILDDWVNIDVVIKNLNRYAKEEIEQSIKYLVKFGFVKKLHETLDGDFDISITKEGLKHLENKNNEPSQGIINISGVSNSNISINSSDISQFIKTNEVRDKTVIEKLEELKDAIDSKNKIKLKSLLTWLTDKAFDVLLSILMNGLKL